MKEEVIDTLKSLFGENTRLYFDTYIEPTVVDVPYAALFWKVEYLAILIFLAFTAIIIHQSDGVIGRVFKMTLSFPALMRQLNYVNQSVDIVTGRISMLFFLILPFVSLSYCRTLNSNLLLNDENYSIIFRLIVMSLIVFVYDIIIKFIFLNLLNKKNFYRKLFLAQKIHVATYIIILFPLLLLTFVSSPYHELLNLVQLLLLGLFLVHYLVTELKLFIEEKVSYVQLILYFCTVKAVIIRDRKSVV